MRGKPPARAEASHQAIGKIPWPVLLPVSPEVRSREEWLQYLCDLLPFSVRAQTRSATELALERARFIELIRPHFVPTLITTPEEQVDEDGHQFILYLQLPPEVLESPGNPYVAIILSDSCGFVTITLDWEVRTACFDAIQETLAKNGYTYVPFTVFAQKPAFDGNSKSDEAGGWFPYDIQCQVEDGPFDAYFG